MGDPRRSLHSDHLVPHNLIALSHAPRPPWSSVSPRTASAWGSREVQMAGLLHLTFRQYQELEAGDLWISFDLYERIVELCGWPRG
jgi:hypothetical protein